MILKDAINNILVDINSYQGIRLVCKRDVDSNSISYNIDIAMVNLLYLYRIECDEYIAVHDYQMDTVENAKSKLHWIFIKYSLRVESIAYFSNIQLNELYAKFYKDNCLSYVIETKRITRKEMVIRYTTITHPIIYKDFVRNFEDISELVKKSCRKFDLELVLRQEHPTQMARRLKLESVNIE